MQPIFGFERPVPLQPVAIGSAVSPVQVIESIWRENPDARPEGFSLLLIVDPQADQNIDLIAGLLPFSVERR